MRFNGIHQSRVDAADSAYVLTDEERDVLALPRRGKSVVAIGLTLGLSESTVKRRRASAAKKLKDCG